MKPLVIAGGHFSGRAQETEVIKLIMQLHTPSEYDIEFIKNLRVLISAAEIAEVCCIVANDLKQTKIILEKINRAQPAAAVVVLMSSAIPAERHEEYFAHFMSQGLADQCVLLDPDLVYVRAAVAGIIKRKEGRKIDAHVYRLGNTTVHSRDFWIKIDMEYIYPVNKNHIEFLRTLLAQPTKIFSSEFIFESAWKDLGSTAEDPGVVRQAKKKINLILGPKGSNIKIVHKKGVGWQIALRDTE